MRIDETRQQQMRPMVDLLYAFLARLRLDIGIGAGGDDPAVSRISRPPSSS